MVSSMEAPLLGSSLSSLLGCLGGLGSGLLGDLGLLLDNRLTVTDNVDEMRDGVGGLGALGDPGVNLLEVNLDGLGVGQGVVVPTCSM